MTHPFISSLSDKSMEELQTAIQDLITQLLMILDSYKQEHNRKMDDLLKKQNTQTQISIKKES